MEKPKIVLKQSQNRVRNDPWSVQNASGTHPKHTRATKMQKNGSRSQKKSKNFFQGAVLGGFWDPAGTLKSTKNGPGSEKVRPETAPEANSADFSRHCRFEWVSGPIFRRSDPPKLCSNHSGSTILTKSPFSKKHRKSSLRGCVFGPKITENRRRRPPNRQNWRKKSIF